jgi:hypothetical protein
MFERIVAIALLSSIFAGGFAVGGDESAAEEAAAGLPTAATSLRIDVYSSTNPWEFIRNSTADNDGDIAVKPLLREYSSWRMQPTIPPGVEESSRQRPSGLILLCQRARQARSGVLKA